MNHEGNVPEMMSRPNTVQAGIPTSPAAPPETVPSNLCCRDIRTHTHTTHIQTTDESNAHRVTHLSAWDSTTAVDTSGAAITNDTKHPLVTVTGEEPDTVNTHDDGSVTSFSASTDTMDGVTPVKPQEAM